MRQALKLHPDSRSVAVSAIEVDITRATAANLVLRYRVTGKIEDLRIPSAAAPKRADELWKHTCFEAFVRAPASDAYCELNFSPSREWAAYAFASYRSGMKPADGNEAPRIEVAASTATYELRAALSLGGLASEPLWRLNLSAVIEEASGNKSYWAFMHPPGKPDFHHSDCFALELATA